MLLLKALVGTLALGGVSTPIALSQTGLISSSKSSQEEFGAATKEIEATPENKDIKVQKVTKWLKDRNCQLLQNPENENDWSNALYACERQANGKANFYYVGPENSFITEIESNLIRKVTSVNYLEDKERETAILLLNLEDGESINWKVAFESGWQYFTNVNLSEQCIAQIQELGEDHLLCELDDPEKIDSTFSYVFSVF